MMYSWLAFLPVILDYAHSLDLWGKHVHCLPNSWHPKCTQHPGGTKMPRDDDMWVWFSSLSH